ncbi:MAG: PH domain-containing protein [Ignavibacteriales bacterium]|nr:PH domain-containing protein [Ignavibacteriales bacterium]
MSYLENNLLDDEKIIFNTKLHWIMFLWPAIFLIITLMIFDGHTQYTDKLAGLFLIGTLVLSIYSYLNYKSAEFGFTNKRVLVKYGFFSTRSIEILLNKVESIQVNQSVIGRFLGYGSIIIRGTGGTKNPFHKIIDPFTFREIAQEQIDIVQKKDSN